MLPPCGRFVLFVHVVATCVSLNAGSGHRTLPVYVLPRNIALFFRAVVAVWRPRMLDRNLRFLVVSLVWLP